MKRLIKLFAIQTTIAIVVAIPTYFYLRSDYREFQAKKQIASQAPPGIGAVCGDGWYSGSTGRGTCSHHGGVKYWGTELQQIAQANWVSTNYFFFFILGAGLIGWYAYGAKTFRDGSVSGQVFVSNQLQRQCCTESLAQDLRFCAVCGAALAGNETYSHRATVSPRITYVLMTATTFLSIALLVLAIVYVRSQQNVQVASVVPVGSPSPSPSPAASPTPAATLTPKPTPTANPEDDLDAGLIERTDPSEDAVRSAKEKSTPTPDPYFVPSRERTVNSPTPRPTIYSESLIYASDALSGGTYSKSEDKRTYRFHLSQQAHVKGTFSAHGNVSVYIVGGYYSSKGEISSDSIDMTLSAGTYEVFVSARQIVGFSLHLTAYYDE